MLRLHKHKTIVSESRTFRETLAALEDVHVTHIRCLALGSPCTETQAPYQLAYLAGVAETLHIEPQHVSLYDPAFNDEDRELFAALGYVVSPPDQYIPSPRNTLYYMPHCPRSVAEQVFQAEQPEYVLGNNISVVIGTLSAASFLQQFPLLAHLDRLCAGRPSDDSFTVVRKKRSRHRYVPPQLDYDFSQVYCTGVDVREIHSDAGVWRNSFSDLALNIMKTGKEGENLAKGKENLAKDPKGSEKKGSGNDSE